MKAVISTQNWYPVFTVSDSKEDIKKQPQFIYDVSPDLLKRYQKATPPEAIAHSGGFQKSQKSRAEGSAAAYMKGSRRPHRVFVRSDQAPTAGSLTASMSRAAASEDPTIVAETPSTAL